MAWKDGTCYRRAAQKSDQGSFYHLFKVTHDYCKIETATLSGRFHNCKGDEWLAYMCFGRPYIRAEIEDYVCHRFDRLRPGLRDNEELDLGELPPFIIALKQMSAVEKS